MKKFIILFLTLFLVGCKNNDINNLAVINEIVIDYKSRYLVYAKVLDNNNDMIYSEYGDTLEECFSNLSSSLNKKTYLTHLETLFLTDSIKKNQYDEIVNYFLMQESSRNSFNTIIINQYNEKIFDFKSIELNNMLDVSINSNGLVKYKHFDEIIKDILNYKLSYIPFFDIKEKRFIGYKSIYDENKLLSKDKSIALNFLFNNINNVTLLIDNNNYKLENCNTNIKKRNNYLYFNIKCEYDGNDTNIVKDYLNNSINSFRDENKNNYFNFISYKYGIDDKSKIIINVDLAKIKRNSGDNFA